MTAKNESSDQAPRSGAGIMLALAVGLLWGAAIGGTWYFYRENDSEGGLAAFVGRFHILLVHLPIGLLFIVPLMEMAGWTRWGAKAKAGVPFVLWMAVLTAGVASVLGFLMMNAEGTGGRMMTLHMWTGLGVGLFAVLALVFKMARVGSLYTLTLLVTIALTAVAGHYGGALVHDEEYLTEHAPEPIKPLMEKGMTSMTDTLSTVIGLGETALADVIEDTGADTEADTGTDAGADMDIAASDDPQPLDDPAGEEVVELPISDQQLFSAFVLPILESKCTECHSEEKIKGKLRLDNHEMIMAGAEGTDYPTVIPGDAEDESELIVRVMLPDDDDDFMPPDGKDKLTDQELAVLRWWIAGGAPAEGTVAELEADEDMIGLLAVVAEGLASGDDEVIVAAPIGIWPTLSAEEQQLRIDAVKAAAVEGGFSVLPISAEDDRLRISAVNATANFGDEQIAALQPVSERVVWLDLGRTQVTDQGLEAIGRMPNLERLHLENTAVSDAGVKNLARLAKLEYLNLYGTEVTSAIFEPLAELRSLRKLFLWETKVDHVAAQQFQRQMSLEVNTGWDVAVNTTEVDPAKPETVAEEKPKATEPAEAPKAEPKPGAKPKVPEPAAKPKADPAGTEAAKPATKPKPAPKPKADVAKPDPKPANPPAPAPKPSANPEGAAKPSPQPATQPVQPDAA